MCFYGPHLSLVPAEARRGCQVPWNWSDKQLWAALWVLEIKPCCSAKAASALTAQSSLHAQCHLTVICPIEIDWTWPYHLQQSNPLGRKAGGWQTENTGKNGQGRAVCSEKRNMSTGSGLGEAPRAPFQQIFHSPVSSSVGLLLQGWRGPA